MNRLARGARLAAPVVTLLAALFPDVGRAAETLHVRFADDAGNRCTARGCTGPAADALSAARTAGAQVGGCYGVPEGRLRALRAVATRLSGSGAPDLTQCFALTVPQRDDALASRLRGAPGAVFAQWASPVVPAQMPTPDFSGAQFVLDDPPSGLGARTFWSRFGRRGEGVLFADIELGVDAAHLEFSRQRNLLAAPGAGVPLPVSDEPFDHAVASMGIVVAADDGVGVVGMAPQADARFFTAYPTAYQWGAGPAILRALNTLGAGDVLLLELQRPGPAYDADREASGQYGMVPLEWAQIDRDAIELATRLGVTVVEPAGNGYQDLDAPLYEGRFSDRDSGALVVCAGNPPTGTYGPARQAMSYTNFGSRCDLQGYGADVLAPGYADLWGEPGSTDRLTAVFGGTSAASPQVAAAAVLLSSLARAFGGYVPPAELRRLLVETGTPGDRTIGPLPDLLAAAEALPAFIVERPAAGYRGPWAVCRVDGDCDAGLACVAVAPGERYCLEACEPFEPEAVCGPGRACMLAPWGGGVCAPDPGAGRTGDPCDSELDCAANYFCDAQIGCQPVCSVSRGVGCGARQTCVFSGEAYGDVGVCVFLSPNPDGADDTAACARDADCQGGYCCCHSDPDADGQCTTPGCRDASDCNGSGLDCIDDPALGVPFCAVACGPGLPCPAGFICDEVYCRRTAACVRDADCGAGERCIGGLCDVAFCAGPAECAVLEDCVDGRCVERAPACRTDGDCAGGTLCLDGECVPLACGASGDCPVGTWCRGGLCFDDARCESAPDCRASEVCRGGRCLEAACVVDGDCPRGGQCIAGTCEAAPPCPPHRIRRQSDGACIPDGTCAADADCALPYACSAGRCRRTAACDADEDCRAGFVCAGALCVPARCAVDDDCGTGHRCVAGACERRPIVERDMTAAFDAGGPGAGDAGDPNDGDAGPAQADRSPVPGGRGCGCRAAADTGAGGVAAFFGCVAAWGCLRRRRRRSGAGGLRRDRDWDRAAGAERHEEDHAEE
ncbi:S8 family serine peptidase [Myxococcota bacterium]|nr:S8 family serine peptidase [Myxococcota bacterium]